MKHTIVAVLSIAVLSLFGQTANKQPKPKPVPSLLDNSWPYSWKTLDLKSLEVPHVATFTQKITSDGSYVATFEDKRNEWRCAMTSLDSRPETHAVTIVCTLPDPRAITDERKPASTK